MFRLRGHTRKGRSAAAASTSTAERGIKKIKTTERQERGVSAAAAATIGPFNTDTVSVSDLPATAKPLIHVDVAKVFPPAFSSVDEHGHGKSMEHSLFTIHTFTIPSKFRSKSNRRVQERQIECNNLYYIIELD